MKKQLTSVSVLHYIRLVYRSLLFLGLLGLYLSYRIRGGRNIEQVLESRPAITIVIWLTFTMEMILRFFPSRLESPGSQKQFAENYINPPQKTSLFD